ncbi:MAG TPA: Calx-beta domain-containing protein [Pyrinomonadaceae bacterium]
MAHSQTGLRRITNTTQEGLNLNPSLSGDGLHIAFETTEDVAQAGGSDHFRAVRADVATEPASFIQMGGTRAPAPAISQDGSRIAFASKDNPLGTNPDSNSEIFLFDGTALRQITNTSPGNITDRVRNGNFQPSISDDGRFIAFSSNRDLVGLNADANLEIFIYDALTQAFTQITNSLGTVGATDAKISGNGTRVAYIRDGGATASTQRDLVIFNRQTSATQVASANVPGLALTYGRAISDDGTRVVFSALSVPNATQVFLFDGRSLNLIRPITFLRTLASDVPLHPTISGDGSRLAFATRRNVIPGTNEDDSVELYTFDIPTGLFGQVTDVKPKDPKDPTITAEVVSSLNDQGTLVAFNFPRLLSGPVNFQELGNNSEIYLTATPPRAAFGNLTVLNGASFGHEPSTTKAVAPNSIAVALGGDLANSTEQSQRQTDGTFPRNVGGTTVTVNNRPAQIFFISPAQVNFLVPPETETGTAQVVVTNATGFETRGTVTVLRSAPGVFTFTGDGTGEGVILDATTLQPGPFDPSNGQRRLIVFATGVRNAAQTVVTIGGRVVTVEAIMPSPNMPGLDEIHLLLPADLRGAGMVELFVRADGRDSNPVNITLTGEARRDVLINEVLADPPDGLAGDANHDGTRDTAQDEFVEIVNATASDIDISGYELLARGTSGSQDTLRHRFAQGTILPAGAAIVVFGGGTFDPANPLFGGAQVVKASTGSLSLVNGGGVVTLREPTGAIASLFSYGGSTNLNADANQSLTRSPDVTGNFTGHLTAAGSGERAYSPGTRVDGSPFLSPAIARIEVTPATASIFVGQGQQFTARAFDANGQELSGVIFIWQSSNPAIVSLNQNGLARGVSEGTAEIRASARGVQSAPATVTVSPVERVLTRIEVTPSTASIPVGGAQLFTARAFDQFDNEMTGVGFVWSSSDNNIATVDQSGLATGINQGSVTITASAQNVSGTATLNVTPPTIVINEALADPPDGSDGDANHDGTRDSNDDEFIELVNSTAASISLSGWTLRTRTLTGTTETTRHTFAAGTALPASEAIVVFGGGTFDPVNPLFGCAQVVKASTAGLSLTNGGLTIILRDAAGNLVTQLTYGGTTNLSGDQNQSLTRSPDITGSFALHTAASGSGGRRFSPGTRVNGAPFGSCAQRLTSVTISPSSSSVLVGETTQFTARAFDQFGSPLTGATITFASDNTGVATIDSVTVDAATGIATATVKGQAQGTAHITAQATDGTTTVTSTQATLTVNTVATTYSVSGQVRDSSNNPVSGVLIMFEMDFQGTLSAQTTLTDANGNYTSGDLGCQNTVKVTPSKAGYTFTPVAIAFTSTRCLSGNDTANFTAAPPPPGTLVISQIYVGGGNAGAAYTNDFVEIFNSGTTTVDFSVTPYSIQYVGITGSFGATGAANKTNITSGTIAPGQYFLVQEASGGAIGAALPTADATGSINMAAAGGKLALVVGTTALPAATCPGDDGASPFNPSSSSIADFIGYGSSATTVGHCYEGPGPATAPSSTNADFRKSGGCVDTNFNADDFLVAAANPRNTSHALNNCSAGLTPEITINDPASVAESTANVTFIVTLSTPSASTVTVDYATANNTATAGSDYQTTSGTLTFAPGETSRSITVPIINDTMDEPSETFFVNLTNASHAVILDNQGQATITDNDAAPTLAINDVSVAEGNSGTTTASFNVTLSAPSGFTVTVNYATADDTATSGSDYQSTSGTLSFNPGQTAQAINVLVNGDTTFEPNETFFVNLSGPASATISDSQGQGTITNDDAAPPIPAITINDVSLAEGDSGTKAASFTVSLSMSPTQAVTVDYATANGTATAGVDYQSTSGTLTFNPGDPLSKTISVTVNGDTLVEPGETFFVNLSNAANATITDAQGVGTITNDDTANLVISQVYGGGNNSGATYQRDFVEIFNRGTTTVDFSLTPYSVQYASAGANFGSNKTDLTSGAIAPGHYFLIQEAGGTTNGIALPAPDATDNINLVATAGKVALVAGTALLPAAICPGDDGVAPFNPNNAAIADFIGYGNVVCYEGPGPAPAPSNTTADFRKAGGCTDTNDNAADFFVSTPHPRNSNSPVNNCSGGPTPNLTISDATVTEGNSGTVTATFTVSLSALASGADVTFDIATQNNTALSGSDYVARSLTNQVIPAGQQTYTFTVTVNGDTAIEPDETFFVNVTNVAGATVTDAQATGTIQNDDLPSLSINDVTVNEGNSGTTTFNFTVHLSAAAPATVTFDISTADVTARDGNPAGEDNDYVARSLTAQTIAAGQQDYNFAVTVNGDLNIEPDETFFVNVTNVVGATVTDGQGLGTIQNDDSPVLSINDVSLSEGDSGTKNFTFTVTSTLPAPAGGITFDISTADGTAQDGNPAGEDNDYVARSLTAQTIPVGQQTFTFDVTVKGDLNVEPGETFFVNLTNVSGASVSDSQGQGTIQNDDTANLVISQVYGGGGNNGAPYTHDFVEIFNRGTTTVNFALTPYSIQYAGATGNFGTSNITIINSGTVAPGRYFLIQEASGGAVGVALPTPDATGTIIMAATAGKVALVAGSTPVSGVSCPGDDPTTTALNPTGNNIVDFVGYGTTAACYEGAGPAPAPSATNADFRKSGGCIDTNNNAADFTTSTPSPRNTSTPPNVCAAPVLSINDVTISEGNAGTTTATFTVSLNTTSTQAITVDYATADNTATAPSDYLSTSNTLTFNPGDLTKTINVTVNGDTLDEVDETFFVNLTNASNATISDAQGQGTITDDDNAPTLSIDDVTVTEGNAGTVNAAFTVTLSAQSGKTVTVDYATADSTATAPADYQAATTTTLTFNPGTVIQTINVTVKGDTLDELNETFFVNLTNPVNATITDAQGQGTITDDDATPSLSIDDVTVTEGNSGTNTATFTVTLSAASGQTVTVDYATADGTATAPADYVAVTTTTLTFTPGTPTRTLTVTYKGDTLDEPDETFFVNLTNASNATISDAQGQGTITDDDATPSLSINDVPVTEGNSGTTNAVFTVTLSAASGRTVTVDYATADGTALADSDYQSTSGSLSFAPGDTTKQITVPVKGDTDAEPNETYVVNLTNAANATISDAQGQGTITDDDTVLPTLSINDVTVNEADGNAVFTVTLSTASTQEVKVDFSTNNGTAIASSDYTAQTGTLTFTVGGSLTQNISVPIINDTRDEPSQTFTVDLSNPVNAAIADGQGQGTITDNDNPPTLSINSVSTAEGNAGATTLQFTVTLSTESDNIVTVNYATADDTATAPSDYLSTSNTLTFNPGDLTKTINVTVNGDTLDEVDETFFVNLSGATNASITSSQGTGTITDDDPQPSLSISSTASAAEGNSGTANSVTFNVTLSTASGKTVQVGYATASGTATQGTDYTNTFGTLIFNPGVTSQPISVPVIGDTTFEPDETFTVTLSSPVNATIASGTGTGTITNDDPAVVINEVLADPPDGAAGDANLDGTRDATQDEFVELVNNPINTSINISGWTIRTRSGTGPETIRHTFAAGTTLAAGKAIVVFGGGTPAAVSNFGNSQVVTSSTGNLNLTNTGITVVLRDNSGNLVQEFTYTGSGALNGNNNQSLTRSPDITGGFVQHLSATGAGTRAFSPGTKVDGTSF